MSLQRLIMAVFFLQPIAFGCWLPRIPEIQARLSLGPADLAMALLGLPVGTLLTLPFAGRFVARIGGRATILYGFMVFLVLVSLPAFATSMPMLFCLLALLGVALSTLELGLNVEADDIEKTAGVEIMSRCHGFWSLGIMAGSLIGAALLALRLPPEWSILGVAVAVLPLAILVSARLPRPQVKELEPHLQKPAGLHLPSKALLAVSLFVFGITMTEGAIADWSAVYLKGIFQTTGMTTGIGYTIFALMAAAGRFAGDAMKGRFGAVTTARLCGCSSLLGLGIVLLAPNAATALVGFAAVGFGVSVGFPLAVTASASIGDRPAAENVAILTFIALAGFLVGPPMIGFVAEVSSLRIGLATLLPTLCLSLALTHVLAPKAGRAPKRIVVGEIL